MVSWRRQNAQVIRAFEVRILGKRSLLAQMYLYGRTQVKAMKTVSARRANHEFLELLSPPQAGTASHLLYRDSAWRARQPGRGNLSGAEPDARKRASCKGRRPSRCVIDALLSLLPAGLGAPNVRS
jgi:hypothetical protein